MTDAHRLLGVEDEEVRLLRMSWGDVGELVNAMSANDEWSERDFGVLQAFRQVVEGWEAIHSGEGCVRQLQYSGGDTTERIGPCYLLSGGHPPQTDIININDLGSSTNHSTTLRPNTESRSVAALMRTTRASSKTFEARWAESQEDLAATLGGDFMAEPLGWRGGVEDLSGSFRLSVSYLMSLLSYIQFSAIPEDTIPASSDASEEDSDHVRNRFRHFIGLIYLAMVAFAGWQVSFATRVHSRIGLAVTGIVQVLISAVMSLSVLALIGWNGWGWSTMPSSVPLWSLPMVVVVVGVENMSHLVRIMSSSPLTVDTCGLLDSLSLLRSGAHRSRPQQSRHSHSLYLFDEHPVACPHLALSGRHICPGVLRVRDCRQYNGLVHATYLLLDGKPPLALSPNFR